MLVNTGMMNPGPIKKRSATTKQRRFLPKTANNNVMWLNQERIVWSVLGSIRIMIMIAKILLWKLGALTLTTGFTMKNAKKNVVIGMKMIMKMTNVRLARGLFRISMVA